MTLPTLAVELALATRPVEAPTWVDVTGYVEGLQIQRGRQYELDRVEAGTARITLKNLDRRFDPANAAGPYYPNLKPMRRVRVSATWSGTTHYLFSGYVERWPPTWPLHGVDARVEIPCVDGLKILGRRRVTVDFGEQRTSDRISQLLSLAGFTLGNSAVVGLSTVGSAVVGPNGDHVLDVGLGRVQAEAKEKIEALSLIHDAEECEQGVFFVDTLGRAVFKNRHARLNTTSNCSFGDGAGELPYADSVPDYDEEHLWNEVHVTADSGDEVTIADDGSRFDYFPRVKDVTSLPVGGPVAIEITALANRLLSRHKDPSLRFAKLLPGVMRSDAVWPYALAADLGYRVTVRRRPPGGGAPIEQECHVEGIRWEIRPQGTWALEWQLSPADTALYAVVGDTTTGVVGTGVVAF